MASLSLLVGTTVVITCTIYYVCAKCCNPRKANAINLLTYGALCISYKEALECGCLLEEPCINNACSYVLAI